MISLCPCTKSSRDNPAKTVKLTPTSSEPKSLVGRYATIKRRCAQTARISLHKPISLKELSADKKHTIRQILGVSLRALSSDFAELCFGLRLSSVPSPSLLRFGRRYLRRQSDSRKREKRDRRKNFAPFGNCRNIWGLAKETAQHARGRIILLPAWGPLTIGQAATCGRQPGLGRSRIARRPRPRPT